jgi:YfiH family protein
MQTAAFDKREFFPSDGLCYEYAQALPVYRFALLKEDSRLVHAVFTRSGGVSPEPWASLNLGHSVGDDPSAVQINHDRVYRALGISPAQSVTCHLRHGAEVLSVTAAHGGSVLGPADALITGHRGVYLTMRFADCTPILLHDPVRGAVGLVHAGWRGTVQNVAGAAVKAMVSGLGCSSRNITAVIGPAIGPCCYQVGEEVIQAVQASLQSGIFVNDEADDLFTRRNGSYAYFDLWEANRRQLAAAGVGRVVVAGICTACHTDQFFSHRAEAGRTGRFGVVIGYRDGDDD